MTDVAAAFTELIGRPPDGVWASPGRVTLIGEHTDYNDGLVLPLAIGLAARVAVGRRRDSVVRCASLQMDAEVRTEVDAINPGSVRGWGRYPLGVLWAMGRAGWSVAGVDVVIDSDLPIGAGLGSSAAVEVALALAVVELGGGSRTHDELARVCQAGEEAIAGAPTGLMDQLAALEGRSGRALFLDCRSLDRELVPFDLDAAGATLLVIDTGVAHSTAEGGYRARREECAAAAAQLGVSSLRDATLDEVETNLFGVLRRRARHVVTENDRVLRTVDLLRRGALRGIGPLLTGGHASLRDDYEVSCTELDVAVRAAIQAGAWGARMTGAGFGGCAIALLPAAATAAVTAAVTEAFARARLAPPTVFAVTASDGARRCG